MLSPFKSTPTLTLAVFALALLPPTAVAAELDEFIFGDAESQSQSAEGGEYEGPYCEAKTDRTSSVEAVCDDCDGNWHTFGYREFAGKITEPFKCGDERSKANAINSILGAFGIEAICFGECPKGETCDPTGFYSSTHDGVELSIDETPPDCSYTATWDDNSSLDATPKACKCIKD